MARIPPILGVAVERRAGARRHRMAAGPGVSSPASPGGAQTPPDAVITWVYGVEMPKRFECGGTQP